MPALGALWRRQATAASSLFRANPAMRARNPRNPRLQSTNSQPSSRRVSRILAGAASRFMPRRLRGALQDLRSAPLSHVFAFLVLHEITAILPIFGLTYAFYTLDVDLPAGWVVPGDDGLSKWTDYFRKKRWFGLEPQEEEEDDDDGLREEEEEAVPGRSEETARDHLIRRREEDAGATAGDSMITQDAVGEMSQVSAIERQGNSQSKAVGSPSPDLGPILEAQKIESAQPAAAKLHKILIQVAAAYAITKMLLVPRIALSLWLTPWLARGFVGFRHALRKKRR